MSFNFPLGLAEGEYFCNRIQETQHLVRNIEHCRHTVLISPRRYGKTSLANKAINQINIPSADVDLFMTTGPNDIALAILAGVDTLLSQISNNAEALLGLIKNYVKSLRPTFEAGSDGFKIKLEPSAQEVSATTVCEALLILDGVLKKKSQQAVLFIDEFQEIEKIAPNQGIEGAIRHVAQKTKHFTILFSGSHRHLLQSMFNDRNKPLYKLCDEIMLERIGEEDYIPFVNHFSKEQWGKTLPTDIIQKLLMYSEQHPYYFNLICDKLFEQKHYPTLNTIDLVWESLVQKKRKDLLAETGDLTIAQKKLLVAIANGINHELTGKKFLSMTELSGATVVRALEYLEAKDYVEKIFDKYRIIDPLLKSLILQLNRF